MPPSRPAPSAPKPAPSPRAPAARAPDAWLRRAWARHPLVAMARHREQLSFYRSLHGLVRAGLPLTLAFAELSRGSGPFQRAVAAVGTMVGAGDGLAAAMRQHPAWFDARVVQRLEVAETTGTLEAGLAQLLEELEEAHRTRQRAVAHCLYPGYLLGAFLLGGAMLEAAGTAMRTGQVDGLASAFLGHLTRSLLQVVALGAVAFVAPLVLASPALAPGWARLRLQLPLLGPACRERQAGHFCRTLGACLGAGLEAGRSLQLALEATGNPQLGARPRMAVQRLRGGARLTDVVAWLGILTGLSLQQLATAEHTGHLPATLAHLAREHHEAATRWVRRLLFVLFGLLGTALFALSLGRAVQVFSGYTRLLTPPG